MNSEQLRRMREDKGFIAALDQSGGSTPKALELYGIGKDRFSNDQEMFDLVHEMRTRVITSPVFDKARILGVILFERTMDGKIDGKPTSEYLWNEKGIVPFLKIDEGLAETSGGVQLMKPMHGLKPLLKKAVANGVFGTKMRSVIHEAHEEGVRQIVAQQFEIAREVIAHGLVPIIEPEVDIKSKQKREAEELLVRELRHGLKGLDDGMKVMFKVSIPDEDGLYGQFMNDPKVVRVVALSGGYSRENANLKLSKNKGLIASFSRALLEGLRADQSADEFSRELNDAIEEIYEASIT